MLLTEKKNNFINVLKEANLSESFEILKEDKKSVQFISRNQKIYTPNINVPISIAVTIQDNSYNDMLFLIGKVNNEKRNDILELFNEFNCINELDTKFMILKNNVMGVSATYRMLGDAFDATELICLIRDVLLALQNNYYKEIMRTLWA